MPQTNTTKHARHKGQGCQWRRYTGGVGSLNTRYSIIYPWTLDPETQTYNNIQGLRVRVSVEMSDRGGGSLNTQYSIIYPWTLDPETQTYNNIQGLRVRVSGEMSVWP